MFTRIVTGVAPADLARLYEMLSCFLATTGQLHALAATTTGAAGGGAAAGGPAGSGVDALGVDWVAAGAAAAAAAAAGQGVDAGSVLRQASGAGAQRAMRALAEGAARACITGLQHRAAGGPG
jgi:hypothetical protein